MLYNSLGIEMGACDGQLYASRGMKFMILLACNRGRV